LSNDVAGSGSTVLMPNLPVQILYVISLTGIVFSSTSSLFILLFRLPMGEPHWTAAPSVLLLTGAVIFTWQEAACQVLGGRWCSYALTLLATLAVLFSPALVWLGAFAKVALYAVLGILWLLGLRSLIGGLRELPWWHTFAAVGAGVTLGAAYFFIVNTKGYGNVLSPEQALVGIQHRDTLYHASLAAMIANYGVVSTGLDGLVPTPYYALSHALIGLIGRWLDVASIHAYYLVPQILGIPLLFFSLSIATYWLWRPKRHVSSGPLVVLVPAALMLMIEIWDWASYLVSESYSLALILLLFALPLLIEFVERRSVTCCITRYITLLLSTLAMFYAKNSVGAIFMVSVAYMLVRLGFVSLLKFGILLAVIAGLGVLVIYQSAYTFASLIGPLHFLTYTDASTTNISAIALMLASALLFWIKSNHDRRQVIEVLSILVVVSLSTGLLVHIDAGGAYYFINVGTWIAIVFASGMLIVPWLAERPCPTVMSIAVALVALAALTSQPQLRESGPKFLALISSLNSPHNAPMSKPAEVTMIGLWHHLLSQADRERAKVVAEARRSPGGQMMSRLSTEKAKGGPDQVVYVPPSNAAFWNLHRLCTAQALSVPALVGLPMVSGLPPDTEACPIGFHYGFGYDFYPKTSRSVAMSDTVLCQKVRQIGFSAAIIVGTAQDVRTLSCR
jgi:hypothetical protein